jgi:hypothetical protein
MLKDLLTELRKWMKNRTMRWPTIKCHVRESSQSSYTWKQLPVMTKMSSNSPLIPQMIFQETSWLRNWLVGYRVLSRELKNVKASEWTYRKLKKLNGSLLQENAQPSLHQISEPSWSEDSTTKPSRKSVKLASSETKLNGRKFLIHLEPTASREDNATLQSLIKTRSTHSEDALCGATRDRSASALIKLLSSTLPRVTLTSSKLRDFQLFLAKTTAPPCT